MYGSEEEALFHQVLAASRDQWAAVPEFMTGLITTFVPMGMASNIVGDVIMEGMNQWIVSGGDISQFDYADLTIAAFPVPIDKKALNLAKAGAQGIIDWNNGKGPTINLNKQGFTNTFGGMVGAGLGLSNNHYGFNFGSDLFGKALGKGMYMSTQ